MNAPSLNTPTTHALVKQLKQENIDLDWYPTTLPILNTIKADMDQLIEDSYLDNYPSVLDCGAGDGRSLIHLTEGSRYAIEKARPLLQVMDESIYIVGADFNQNTLIDKGCQVTFCNPPYFDFVSWTTKIITETCSAYVYLVIPKRWESNTDIQQALELRNAKATVLGEFDFLEADRKARAVVNIVKITLTNERRYQGCESETDPFTNWFNENFKIDAAEKEPYSRKPAASVSKEDIDTGLVKGGDIITVLTELYDRDLQKLIKNYKSLEEIDPVLFQELDVNFTDLRAAFKLKIKGLKNIYWNELFNNLTKITDKLTKGSRENMLEKLTSRTDVDFNSDNIYAVVIWVIKNANKYFDKQLINLVERMTAKANVVAYKSNKKVFEDEDWRYSRAPDDLGAFSLEYRIIMEEIGGLDSSYQGERNMGLSPVGSHFLSDILTVASNLGFDTTNMTTPTDFWWESNKGHDFYYRDHAKGEDVILMSVKAFRNQNLHLKISPKFMARLNVEFGRLKSWVKDARSAADEMDIDIEDAMAGFNSNLTLTNKSLVALGFDVAA